MRNTFLRLVAVGGLAVVASALAAVVSRGASNRSIAPQATAEPFVSVCGTDNPWLVTVCHPAAGMAVGGMARLPTVVRFRDGPSRNADQVELAAFQDVGALWGLAVSAPDEMAYAAAYHKRNVPFGPGGPGAIYRINLDTGNIDLFTQVPDAGADRHGRRIETDVEGRSYAGKTGLGDIDLGSDGNELFVSNLETGTIQRLATVDGRLVGSFPHGAQSEAWATDARLFALAVHDGLVYHGVINTAESTQDRTALAAHVYASRPDGSQMREVANVSLDGPRGRLLVPTSLDGYSRSLALEWLPWKDGYNSLSRREDVAVYPQPMLVDIEFDATGAMVLGLRDRQADVTYDFYVLSHWTPTLRNGEQGGLPVGDILRLHRIGDRWAYDPAAPSYDDGSRLMPDGALGGLAALIAPDILASATLFERRDSGLTETYVPDRGVDWHDNVSLDKLHQATVCRPGDPVPVTPGARPRTLAPGAARSDNSAIGAAPARSRGVARRAFNMPLHTSFSVDSPVLGDLEVICDLRPTPTPSVTTTSTPTARSTSTITASPTSTATRTSTPTAMPPEPGRIFLPALGWRCDQRRTHLDVVLVFDVSTSMGQMTRAGRSKLAAAQEAASTFVRLVDLDPLSPRTDQVAIVGFNREAWTEAGLTTDRGELIAAIDRLPLRMAEFTRLDLAFNQAALVLSSGRRPGTEAAIVLLTDGLPNQVPYAEDGTMETTVRRAADAAKSDGIMVYTIGLGLPGEINPDLLRECASRPELYREAPDAEDLIALYADLAERIGCPDDNFDSPSAVPLSQLEPPRLGRF